MIIDGEKETFFYLRFIYVHSTYLANKGIFIDSKQTVIKNC